jgi:hypothetical protein
VSRAPREQLTPSRRSELFDVDAKYADVLSLDAVFAELDRIHRRVTTP